MEGKARVLIYGFSAEEGERIDAALSAAGVPAAARIRPSQAHVVLSEIIEHDREGPEGFSTVEPLVLFFNVSETGIKTLIPYIRSLDIPRPIFAVVTETSYRWTFAELLEHLVEERRAFERQVRERKARQQQNPGDPTSGPAGPGPGAGESP
ncbi:MAG: DUF3783 domain-containing protein [Spirochaetales bacterium]|nr:DUF3783 domain-containing protein [Spirochaetales bacterium]